MDDPKKHEIPKHLAADGRSFWVAVADIFDLDDHHFAILAVAAESLDRAAEARAAIKKYGVLITPKGGGMARQNPATRVEKDALTMFLRAHSALGLDVETPGQVGRPTR